MSKYASTSFLVSAVFGLAVAGCVWALAVGVTGFAWIVCAFWAMLGSLLVVTGVVEGLQDMRKERNEWISSKSSLGASSHSPSSSS